LLERNMPGGADYERRFDWTYESSPYGPAKCWLVRSKETGEYIGCGTLFPRALAINGERVMGGVVGDTMVDRGHRTLGPALMLQRFVTEQCNNSSCHIIYGFPNQLSEAVNLRSGYKIIGKTVNMVRYLRSRGKIEQKTNRYVASMASPFVDAYLRFGKFERYKGLAGEMVHGDRFLSLKIEFDRLWERVVKKDKIIIERSSQYIEWRYMSHPSKKFEIYALTAENRTVRGYLVYKVENGQAQIFDLLCEEESEGIQLLGMFADEMRKKANVERLVATVIDDSDLVKVYEKARFMKRPMELNVIYYIDKERDCDLFCNPSNWYVTYGDTDL
jgi:hypothetical protein